MRMVAIEEVKETLEAWKKKKEVKKLKEKDSPQRE